MPRLLAAVLLLAGCAVAAPPEQVDPAVVLDDGPSASSAQGEERGITLAVEVRAAGRSEDEGLVAVHLRFTLTNHGSRPVTVPGAWFEVTTAEVREDAMTTEAFARIAHAAWDYDAVPRTRYTAPSSPHVAAVGRVLGDLPGGHRLVPGASIDRTSVVQLPARFAEARVTAGAYAWVGEPPLVLCWRTLQDGSGFPMVWVLDERDDANAGNLDPDARTRICREYERRAEERAGVRPERQGGVPPESDDRLRPFSPESHPELDAAHRPSIAFDRAEVSLWE